MTVLATNGNPSVDPLNTKYDIPVTTCQMTSSIRQMKLEASRATAATTAVNTGVIFGMYGIMDLLGFYFLHPLQPVVPDTQINSNQFANGSVNIAEEPYWNTRGISIIIIMFYKFILLVVFRLTRSR